LIRFIVLLLLCTLHAGIPATHHPWARFRPGSYAKLRITANAGAKRSVTERTEKLLSIDSKYALIEVETRTILGDGSASPSTRTRIQSPLQIVTTSDARTFYAAAPDETIAAGGKKIHCKCMDTKEVIDLNLVKTRTCTNDSVPGATVRAIARTDGERKSETVTELVEFMAIKQ
jgi:hypothetical protein